eukprot:3143303-Prymnesium_polylepis.1
MRSGESRAVVETITDETHFGGTALHFREEAGLEVLLARVGVCGIQVSEVEDEALFVFRQQARVRICIPDSHCEPTRRAQSAALWMQATRGPSPQCTPALATRCAEESLSPVSKTDRTPRPESLATVSAASGLRESSSKRVAATFESTVTNRTLPLSAHWSARAKARAMPVLAPVGETASACPCSCTVVSS